VRRAPAGRAADLSDEQREQIRALLDAERATQERPPAEALLHRQLQSELLADVPDGEKVASLQQQILQAHSARLAKQIVLQQRIAQILTAEQRAGLREKLSQPPPQARRRGPFATQ
jgi:Spy/CpxP family protein refolding chaperone